MRLIGLSVGGALLLSLWAAPAVAQRFDGPYAGLQAGSERTRVRDTVAGPALPGPDDRNDAASGGLFVGYDRLVASRFVVGAEAGMNVSSGDTLRGSGAAGRFSIDPQWSLDLTARAGYLADPRTLIYARGGYENTRIDAAAIIAGSQLADSENRDGWTAGAGIERQLQEHISARLEYRFSDLSEGDGTYDRHRVLAGIAYRF